MVKMSDGKKFVADENYMRESMMNPSAKVVAGYEKIMPTFQGLLREREISALIRVHQGAGNRHGTRCNG